MTKQQWFGEEALPLEWEVGCYGFWPPMSDRIQLNDDSLWPYDLQWEHPPGEPGGIKNPFVKFFYKEMPNRQIL